MKLIIFTAMLLLFFVSGNGGQRQNMKLTIVVSNIKSIKGKIEIALYNSPETFPKDNQEFKSKSVLVKSDSVRCTFIVDTGYFAVALYHDGNSNNICDANILGIPKESYGFSNDIKPFLSAPSFSSTKFLVRNDTIIHIKLNK